MNNEKEPFWSICPVCKKEFEMEFNPFPYGNRVLCDNCFKKVCQESVNKMNSVMLYK